MKMLLWVITYLIAFFAPTVFLTLLGAPFWAFVLAFPATLFALACWSIMWEASDFF